MAKHKGNSAHSDGGAPAASTVTIQGIQFDAPAPYSEGHPLTAAEAATLNQVLCENLRNNFAEKVRQAKNGAGDADELDPATVADLKSKFAEYAATYQFHGRRSTRAPADPVQKEARRLAKSIVAEQARKKNIDLKSLAEGKMDALIDQLLFKNPAITEEAQARVAAAKRAASSGIDELFADE